MKTFGLLRRQRALLNCAPISQDGLADRSMRSAVYRAAASADFGNQQNFDRAIAELVRRIPIPPVTAASFSEKELAMVSKSMWMKICRKQIYIAVISPI